ncbi:MAG: DNA mismatch repair protein MutS [Calditrichaeota bacterium]|nr:DNA mismatch repair protein MutS [Calditrichota bacterium]
MEKSKRVRTPMLDQFMKIKSEYPDAILFFRMGDFYEMFFEDAKIASEILGLRLTSRAHGKKTSKVPLAGFPHHQIDSYMTRMVKAKQKIVVVEQIEDPKLAKGLVKRAVVRVATAGTNPAAVDQEEIQSNRIAALIRHKSKYGLAWADIVTGEFQAGEFSEGELKLTAGHLNPVEIILPESRGDYDPRKFLDASSAIESKVEDWIWESSFARQTLLDHFGTRGLKGFGIEHLDLAISSAGALLHYLKGNLHTKADHMTHLARADVKGNLVMEASTLRNLELVDSLVGNHQATLFAVINHCITGSGKRLLYNRLLSPLADIKRIEHRLDAVESLKSNIGHCNEFRDLLKQSGDIQRLLARLATGRGSARDLVGIRETLIIMPDYQNKLLSLDSPLLKRLEKGIRTLDNLKVKLQESLHDNPPLYTHEGGMVRDGYNIKIDELRQIRSQGKSWLGTFEAEEKKRTGIPNLKVGFNRVFGYYIEVTKSHVDKTPDNYQRRQTLVGAERYITPELGDFESKLVGAEDKIFALEKEIFQELVELTLEQSAALQENAQILANIDFLCGLAVLAEEEGYNRPTLNESDRILLKGCRHPVVEKLLPPGEAFIPNDLEIGGDGKRIQIVTGPNMAGKSTYLRQIALSIILAQLGSFIPAESGQIGVVDKLFTRIGALDNLAGGESTFLVEMQETASILHNATDRSLVVFDEVGRGTSTFDGLSLAWSIVEYLHEKKGLRPRTLFATHFHEMVELEKHLEFVENRNVAVREYDDKVVFLRKIVSGGSNRSFGIHVAQMAGLPPAVISRAKDVLKNLEANDLNPGEESSRNISKTRALEESIEPKSRTKIKSKKIVNPKARVAQLTFFDPVEKELRTILETVDPNNITPLEALNLVVELKRILN